MPITNSPNCAALPKVAWNACSNANAALTPLRPRASATACPTWFAAAKIALIGASVFFKATPKTSTVTAATLNVSLIIIPSSDWSLNKFWNAVVNLLSCPSIVSLASNAAAAAAPCACFWFSRSWLYFSVLLSSARIDGPASVPNALITVPASAPDFLIFSRVPAKPSVLRVEALISTPNALNSFPTFPAATWANAVFNAVNVTSAPWPPAVICATAAFTSSSGTPNAAATGATFAMLAAYSPITILPSFCVWIKPSTSFAALSASNP